MNWYLKALKQYADFGGRARRKEYWMFFLFNVIFSLLATLLDHTFGLRGEDLDSGTISIIYSLLVLIPGIAVAVRRLHDIGKSGWMLLVVLIPLIGFIWLIVLFVTEGDRGINKYGPNPKEVAIWSE